MDPCSLLSGSFHTPAEALPVTSGQVKDLTGGSGSDLLVCPVARLRAVSTVPGQHKYHLGMEGGGKGRPSIICVPTDSDLPTDTSTAHKPLRFLGLHL
ncbi:hypothetical protein EYF80_003316 [Liparis tanakae]|uniref:Uncharacterized protein n=1 Tax=Liparis tanakae TaxID=230148 RepID=A0A4Z2J8K9_9TELE|nr:hypothetical protein EYF80_003316 [Liparis tanakae]